MNKNRGVITGGIYIKDSKYVELNGVDLEGKLTVEDSDVKLKDVNFTGYENEQDNFILHDKKIKKICRNDKCICGSGKKYKDCCENIFKDTINVCLLTGNGLTISALLHLNLNKIDTHDFFNWDVSYKEDKNKKILEDLPLLSEYLSKKDLSCDNFSIVEDINEFACRKDIPKAVSQGSDLLNELRHYICMSFSKFQIDFDKNDISDWNWVKFLRALKYNISYAVSFNYDLVLERAMECAGISYSREGMYSEISGVGILKPHGSIDFDSSSIICNNTAYPPKINSYRTNSILERVDTSRLLSPRKEVAIILPNEYSYQTEYQWIKPGYEKIEANGKKITHLIIGGLSYCRQDRKEIDLIIDSLDENAKVIVINKGENLDLAKKLESKFKKENIYYKLI